jgi:hypothetical protein
MIFYTSLNPVKRPLPSLRQLLSCLLLTCLASCIPVLQLDAAPIDGTQTQVEAGAFPTETRKERACAQMGMTVALLTNGVDGSFCEPAGNSVSSKIVACLKVGMEAVLVPEWPSVVCATPMKGGEFLDGHEASTENKNQYAHPHKVDVRKVCEEHHDQRILGKDIIKKLVRQLAQDIDPIGMRIIGGIFCFGLDLSGLDIPYSLVLDRSIVGEGGQVDLRNFRTRGDLSMDNMVVYTGVRIRRSEISGSIYGERAFLNKLEIGDSVVKGSIKLDHSFIVETLNLENISVDGDVDISTSYFSALEVLKDKIDGVLDLSRSQSRCTYDVRKNKIRDMVAVQLGFGAANVSKKGEVAPPYSFKAVSDNKGFGRPAFLKTGKRDIDPYDRFSDPAAAKGTARFVQSKTQCQNDRALQAGTFLLVDNDIESSLCIRSFNWLSHETDFNRTLKSNIYLNEDGIDGAAWLDFVPPSRQAHKPSDRTRREVFGSSKPDVSIFNVKAGTLVLNFEFTELQEATLNVNGLHFERIYASQADCEAALSIRSSRDLKLRPSGDSDATISTTFPPKLELPETKQVIAWIDKNSFSGTQQPFAEFVGVFERAGNSEAAKNLRISAANAAFKASVCGLVPSFFREAGPCRRFAKGSDRSEHTSPERSMLGRIFIEAVEWLERAVLVLVDAMLWLLADHGYRPERIGWFVMGTLLFFMLALFPFWLGIVGYSVKGRPDKVNPVGLVFLFDRLLPAYRLREENYEIAHYYVLPKKGDNRNCAVLNYHQLSWIVAEANERETERAEKWLDVLKFLGLVFTIFIIAAIGKLAR